jgi:hypothetical protein
MFKIQLFEHYQRSEKTLVRALMQKHFKASRRDR